MTASIEPLWVSKETIIAMHDRQIAEFGGASGVRDMGLLESAIMRPQNAFYYEHVTSLTRLAAKYAHGIAKNHAFVDGNKRTAFMSCYLFLLKNGFAINASEQERFTSILSLAEGVYSEEDFTNWLDRYTQKDTNS